MRSIVQRISDLNERFADAVSRITGWSAWLSLITFGTVALMAWSYLVTRRFDFLGPVAAFWIFFLTVQTSIDAAAQRQNSIALRRLDEKRETHQAQQMDAIAELTLAMRDELDRGKDRDEAAAQRDEILRQLLSKLITFVTEEQQ